MGPRKGINDTIAVGNFKCRRSYVKKSDTMSPPRKGKPKSSFPPTPAVALPSSSLNLSCSGLERLSDDFLVSVARPLGGLLGITKLNLAQNYLEDVPDCIGHMNRLEALMISENRLRRLPFSVTRLASLRHLSLDNNKLEGGLVGDTTRLKSLVGLSACGCALKEVEPSTLAPMKALEYLHLSFNKLSAVPAVPSTVTNLFIPHNNIDELPPSLGLPALSHLNLAGNWLTVFPLPAISLLPRLTVLNLSRNRISGAVPSLAALASLAELHLSKNAITSLPADLHALQHLAVLAVDRNELKELPKGLFSAPSLRDLNAAENSITEYGGLLPDKPSSQALRNICLYGNQNDAPKAPEWFKDMVKANKQTLEFLTTDFQDLPDLATGDIET